MQAGSVDLSLNLKGAPQAAAGVTQFARVQLKLEPLAETDTVVVRNDVLEAHPSLGPDLFNAFAEARRRYIDRLRGGKIDAADPVHVRVIEMGGDPLPYGIEPNRQMLEAIVQYSVEQGILSRPIAIEDLFAPNTRTLTA